MLNKNMLAGAIATVGMTHGEVAAAIGVSKNTFSAKLNGRSCFNTQQIDDICCILGITDPIIKANIFLFNPSQNRDEIRK
ncbi:MAG: helix-turn-helix transcriptional regulator [Christensenellaceae bacterium]|nr:helix-turn-helix transcriptional regulator [Christensenellaceae bacterium]